MNISEIKKKLEELFSQKEYYENRKIVFWIDDKKDFEEDFEKIEIDNVNKVKLHKNNFFTLKLLIETEKKNENFLIYSNNINLTSKENWLIDIYLYSESFYADKINLVMKEVDIAKDLKEFVIRNKNFFRSSKRIENLKKLQNKYRSEDELIIGMLSVLCNIKSLDKDEILKRILTSERDDENALYQEIIKYLDENDVWNYIKKTFGYGGENSLKKLLYFLFITDLSRQISPELLKNYESSISISNISYIEVFLNHWRKLEDKKDYKELANIIQKELNLDNTFGNMEFSLDEIREAETFELFDKLIIGKILEFIDSGHIEFDKFYKLIESRETKFWFKDYKEIYNGLYYYLKMLEFDKKNNIDFDSVEDGIEKYKSVYYKMDYYYRKFYSNYNPAENSIILKKYIKNVESLYKEYTDKLNRIWDGHLIQLKENWHFKGIKQQQNISSYLPPNKKTAIIISDALRYEVGKELADKLKNMSGDSVSIDSLVSVIPSITSLGMAALIPKINGTKNKIEIKNNGEVQIKDKRISSMEERFKLIESDENILAFKYEDIVNLSINERREYFKGKKIILIYHNTIDKIGDNKKTEDEVFQTREGRSGACESAIEELLKLVKTIKNSDVYSIIITADHGFIYQFSSIKEIDKLEKLDTDNAIIGNKRFFLLRENKNFDYVHKFSLSYIDNPEIFVYIPKGNLRFKFSGGGSKFVHGGSSPQEVIIPLIEYSVLKKKADKASYVEIELINNDRRKITSNNYILKFFQKDPISENFIPSKFKVYFVDNDNNIISKIVEFIANSTALDNSERTITKNITLNSMGEKKQVKLIVENVSNNTKKEYDYEINILFPDEF